MDDHEDGEISDEEILPTTVNLQQEYKFPPSHPQSKSQVNTF